MFSSIVDMKMRCSSRITELPQQVRKHYTRCLILFACFEFAQRVFSKLPIDSLGHMICFTPIVPSIHVCLMTSLNRTNLDILDSRS